MYNRNLFTNVDFLRSTSVATLKSTDSTIFRLRSGQTKTNLGIAKVCARPLPEFEK